MADSAQRPLKRQRKATDLPHELNTLPSHQQLPPPPPVDHIFIADGLLNKKPGGKKVPKSALTPRLFSYPTSYLGPAFLLRMPSVSIDRLQPHTAS